MLPFPLRYNYNETLTQRLFPREYLLWAPEIMEHPATLHTEKTGEENVHCVFTWILQFLGQP